MLFHFQLISTDAQFCGPTKEALRRRNAFVNCLKELAPPSNGHGNLQNTVRSCLYALAPVQLWQYFTAQGRSTALKFSVLEDMPNCYQAILTVCAQLSRLPQQTIVSCISNVMKSCKNRAASRKYRRDHPELGLVDETLDPADTRKENDDPLHGLVDLGNVSPASSMF